MRNWIIVLAFVFWVVVITYKFFNPFEADGKEFFQHLSKANVDSIELESVDDFTHVAYLKKVVDRQKLEQFFEAWRGSGTIISNHPRYIWSTRVRFNTPKGVYGGALSGTSNQGVLFTFDQSPSGWPVRAEYQLVGAPERMDRVLQDIADIRR
jgi:hypothetical protein